MNWDFVIGNSCRQQRHALLRRMGQLGMSFGTFAGRAKGVRFRLRTVIPKRRHLTTIQCHNKHANWWEFVTARITDLIQLCHREQEGDRVNAQ